MKTVTEMHTTEVKLNCPYCNEEQEGFISNPRGGVFECDHCEKEYQVHSEADIEYRDW